MGENLATGSGDFSFDIFRRDFCTVRNNASSVLHFNEVNWMMSSVLLLLITCKFVE